MITLKEISKMANVSIATVSKVINGKDENISEATKKRVIEIVTREGYIPNGIAKGLRMRKTRTIGMIIPDVMNLFFSELARGIEDAAEKKGYTVILCNSDNKRSKEVKYLQMLQEKMVDGIIMTTSENSNYDSIRFNHIPLVFLDRDVDIDKKVDHRIGRIMVDNKEGTYHATNYLIERGCRNIGMISSSNLTRSSAERIKGYENAILEKNLLVDKDRIFLESYTIESGYKGVNTILKRSNIDGIVCGNDLIAIGAIKALREIGIKVPEEVKVVGFDDIQIAKYMDPPLTTVKQPIYEIGEEAINMLISLINKEDIERIKILNTNLVKRGSA